MDNSFKTFLQATSSRPDTSSELPVKVIVENKNGFGSKDRVTFLKEKTELFCKKFGEYGMDTLDNFFKESVEKLLNLKTESVTLSTQQNTVKPISPMNALDHANALMENADPKPASSIAQNPAGDDIMARASMMLS